MERHQAAVARLVARYLADPQAIEDVSQETFMRAYTQLRRYRPGTNFRAWLLTIARFLCLAERRRSQRHPPPFRLRLAPEPAAAAPEAPDRESLERLRRAYARLSPPQREVVALRIFEGLGYDEISRMTGDSEATLRSRVHDALEKLRKIL